MTELIVGLSILTVIVIAIVVWKVREDRQETTAEERKARRVETKKAWKDFFKSCIKWLFIILSGATMMTIVSIRPIWQAILPGCIAMVVIGLLGYFLFKWLGIDMDDKNDK